MKGLSMGKTLTQLIVQRLIEDLAGDKHFSDQLLYMTGYDRQQMVERWVRIVQQIIAVDGHVPE